VCVNENSVVWSCKKQTCVALSTQEAEYIAGAELCKSLLGLRHFFKKLMCMSNHQRLYGWIILKELNKLSKKLVQPS
jgi:hypothetical protein